MRIELASLEGGKGSFAHAYARGELVLEDERVSLVEAPAVSGEIRSDIPIVIEEQGKHSLRAHMGNGGGRVDIHTVSGEIRITGTK